MKRNRKPNLLILQPDEYRRRAMGFRGEDPVLTPNLDRFAATALELNRCFSTYPVCSPWRASFLTGQFPETTGVTHNCNSVAARFDIRLASRAVCLSDVLSGAGYNCGYIGKWHLDSPNPADAPWLEPAREDGRTWDAWTPPERRHGFDFWFSYGCCDQHFTPHYWTGTGGPETVLQYRGWSPEIEADEAIRYLRAEDGRRDPDRPFLLMVSMNPPHMPFDEVPERYRALYAGLGPDELLTSPVACREAAPELTPAQRAASPGHIAEARRVVGDYFASVSGVDDQLGRILTALEEEGLDEDTIVLFTSDHGEMMGSHGLMYKGVWYFDSTLVPCLLRWPQHISSGRSELVVNTPDWLPTLLGLLGLAAATPAAVEGVNLAPDLLSGRSRPRDGWYYNAELNARGITDDEGQLIVIRDGHDCEREIYYDLTSDPLQTNDIAARRPAAMQAARTRLDAWLRRTGDRWLR